VKARQSSFQNLHFLQTILVNDNNKYKVNILCRFFFHILIQNVFSDISSKSLVVFVFFIIFGERESTNFVRENEKQKKKLSNRPIAIIAIITSLEAYSTVS
jgi:hypothetical protein